MSYSRMVEVTKRDVFWTNTIMLQQNSDLIDTYLKQLDRTAVQLSMNPNLMRLMNNESSLQSSLYYNIWVLLNNLRSYSITNDFLITFFIHFRDQNYILSHESSYDMPSFYGRLFQYSDMEYMEWYSLMFHPYYSSHFLPAVTIEFENNRYSAVTYLRSFPLANISNPKGTIVLLINGNSFKMLLNNINIGDRGWAYISDQNGTIIASVKGKDVQEANFFPELDLEDSYSEININGEKMIVTSTTSQSNQWDYVAVVPEDYVLRNVHSIKKLLINTLLISFTLGVLAAYYLTYVNTRPLKDIVKSIVELFRRDIEQCENEFDFVQGSISSMAKDNNDLRSSIKRQLPMLRAAFFDKLLHGSYIKIEEMYTNMSYLDIDLTGKYYVVMVVKNYLLDDINSIQNIVYIEGVSIHTVALLNQIEKMRGYVQYIDQSKFAVLLFFNQDDKNSCINSIQNLITELNKYSQTEKEMDLIYGIGNLYDEIDGITYSYTEAIQSLYYSYLGKKSNWFHELPKSCGIYYYPTELEIKFIHTVKNCEKKEANRILKDIYYENFIRKSLTADMLSQLVSDIVGTILKIIDQVNYPANMEQVLYNVNSKSNLQDYYEKIIDTVEEICDYIKEKKSNYRGKLNEDINAYIEKHLTNHELSLNTVAEVFGLTLTYLSKLFKEETGENFSTYVERKRVDYACMLIKENTLQVHEIADRVGYTNDTTFRRAFKRILGLSPREYKNEVCNL